MDAYIYQADTYCTGCGEHIISELLAESGKVIEDYADERTYDSGEFPKGPYDMAYEESDTPAHCGSCRLFLENPLTSHGENYVKEVAIEGNLPLEWKAFYSYLWTET